MLNATTATRSGRPDSVPVGGGAGHGARRRPVRVVASLAHRLQMLDLVTGMGALGAFVLVAIMLLGRLLF